MKVFPEKKSSIFIEKRAGKFSARWRGYPGTRTKFFYSMGKAISALILQSHDELTIFSENDTVH